MIVIKTENGMFCIKSDIDGKSICNDELHICSIKAYFNEEPNLEGWAEIDTPVPDDEDITAEEALAIIAGGEADEVQ